MRHLDISAEVAVITLVGCLEAKLRGLLEWCDSLVVKVRIIDRDCIS